MRASTNDDDVDATAAVEATTIAATNSDTIAPAVSPVLTAPAVTTVPVVLTVPAAFAVPAVPIAPAATAVVPEVFTAALASTAVKPVVLTAPAATAVVPVVLTAHEATTVPAVPIAPAATADAQAAPTAPAPTAVVPAASTAPAATAVVPVVPAAPATTAVVPIITPSAAVEPAVILTTTFSNTDDESALLACQFFRFQCLTNSCSSSTGADEERAVEAAIKGLSEFSHYANIDINYQGENIHGMVNDEETHISPLGKNADQLSSFRNRKGKVFYVTDLHPNRSCCADVLVAIAWKANIKDTFGIIHVLSFDDYIFCLEKRYFTYFKEFLTIS